MHDNCTLFIMVLRICLLYHLGVFYYKQKKVMLAYLNNRGFTGKILGIHRGELDSVTRKFREPNGGLCWSQKQSDEASAL